jgi:HlyD family secretion protein
MQTIRKMFSGRRKLWIILILVIGIVVWRGISLRQRILATTQGQSFRLARVTRGAIDVAVTGTGTVRPHRRWELPAKHGGEVTGVFVSPGQDVKQGQLLAQLETGDVLLSIDDASLELKQIETTISDLQDKYASLTVTSRWEGAVTRLSVKEGQSVIEGAHICTITASHMEVSAYFNKTQAERIALGQEAGVFFLDLLTTVPGKVTHVNQTGEAREGGVVLYPITVEIEKLGALMPGMSVVVEIDTGQGVVKSYHEDNQLSDVVHGITAKAGGTVTGVCVAEGDRVQAGDILVQLENKSIESQIETNLLKLKHAENRLASLEDTLDSQTVTAPEDCTVIDVRVQEGDNVPAGSVIVVVGDLSVMEITLPIDEIDAGKVKTGQTATITADAVPGKQFPGTVSTISFEGKPTGGIATFDAKILVESQGGLLSGMSCDVVINTDSRSNALLLPVEALQSKDGGYVVWVVRGVSESEMESERLSPAAARKILAGAEPVSVEIGLISSNSAEVLSGLQEGDAVLIFSGSSWPFGNMRFRVP